MDAEPGLHKSLNFIDIPDATSMFFYSLQRLNVCIQVKTTKTDHDIQFGVVKASEETFLYGREKQGLFSLIFENYKH